MLVKAILLFHESMGSSLKNDRQTNRPTNKQTNKRMDYHNQTETEGAKFLKMFENVSLSDTKTNGPT